MYKKGEPQRSGIECYGYKHGECLDGKQTRLYEVYHNMIKRTTYPKSINYKSYGARGISVCDEWKNSFPIFKEWALNNGYADNLKIDRIDVNGNYEPNNCRFVNNRLSSLNRRKREDFGIYKRKYGYHIYLTKNYHAYYGGNTYDYKKAIELRDELLNKLNS